MPGRDEGIALRLPTEAEWEYACRAGEPGAFAGTGNLDTMGWYSENGGEARHPLGEKDKNAWGLYDMHGNKLEWCEDWYGAYPSEAVTNPAGPASGEGRVMRGGESDLPARYCRSACRYKAAPASRSTGYGFRPCCPATPEPPASRALPVGK